MGWQIRDGVEVWVDETPASVSKADQERQGLVRKQRENFVPPSTTRPTQIQQFQPHSTSLDIVHPATQEVIVTTSATDRARGFQMIITPISIVVAVLAVLVSFVFDNELFSLATLLIFWLTFAVIYVIGWVLTAVATPEFVSWYSAKRQWNVIEREQVERWNHYKWQAGRIESKQERIVKIGGAEFPVGLAYLAIGACVFLGLAVGLLYLAEGGP
jgi:hypothetical protein